MKLASLAIISAFSLAGPAAAQDGFYYGVGLGVTKGETSSTAIEAFVPTGTDYALALTAGYRFPSTQGLSFGIEGNLDALTAETMVDDATDRAACDNASPTWCEVETVLRLRATISGELANGSRITAALGPVAAQGRGEQSFDVYKDTHGTGMSWGLSWEAPPSLGAPVRIDLNWDKIDQDNLERYDQKLEMVGLRASYMF